MSEKTEKLKSELENTHTRLAELYDMRGEIEASVKKTEAAFIAKRASLDNLQAEQTKLDVLNRSIASLERTRDELQASFDAETAAERRAGILSEAKEKAAAAAETFAEIVSIRQELSDLMKDFGARLDRLPFEFRNRQNELAAVLRQLDPQIQAVGSHVPSVGVTAMKNELVAAGLPRDVADVAFAGTVSVPFVEFERPIAELEKFVGERRAFGARVEALNAPEPAVIGPESAIVN